MALYGASSLRTARRCRLTVADTQTGVEAETRTKQDNRSIATKEKLLDATYEILRDAGHAGLRSASVCEVSGVSRGGLLHHYPTKELLIAATFERIVENMEAESWRRIETASDDTLLADIAADAQSRFCSDSYRIILDILIASGKDKTIVQVQKALAQADRPPAREGWAQRLADTGIDSSSAHQISALIWNMFKGLAARNNVRVDQTLSDSVTGLALELAQQKYEQARRANRND